MPTEQTIEQEAEARYPMDHYTHQVQREAFATCLRERVVPLQAEVQDLKVMVQKLCLILSNSNAELLLKEALFVRKALNIKPNGEQEGQ